MKFLICLLALSFLNLMANSSRVSPHGLEHKQPKDFNIDIIKTVVVGQSGETDFKTVQAAIDSIPSGNNNWIKIHLKNGIYVEKIVIPIQKQKIIIQGNNPSEVIVQYNDAGQADSSGPIVVNAEYFVAINVTFKNSYNSRTSLVPHKEIKVAPSIVLMADKAWFYGCSFISVQDTLADFVGRHYFKNCYIEGAIDFIWGGGQSIYEKCVIYVKGVTKDESVKSGALMAGFITAQGRQSEQDTSGFVFKYCTIKGDGKAYLGRAYRDYSRVVFYATSMSNVIVPQGWDAWHYKGKEDKITFAEVNCTGEGANKQGRVEWDKNLSDRDIAPLVKTKTFISGDGWMTTLPSSLSSL
ncbi:putative pectinesterase 10 [Raphanus sativus]|uniref:pectinesterase n=1 Tax=Raphanus sativus TaxID=3726 RepID=A0A6J0L7S5_RAPSA|nr:putative pectinesterase 10 [Raphanus sativus]